MDLQSGARPYLVKVCGNTDVENLRGVSALGPDLVGLIFAPESPRAVILMRAMSLVRAAEASGARAVGVFRNSPIAKVSEMVTSVGLRMVQLHGDEEVGYINELRRIVPTLTIMKAIPVRRDTPMVAWKGFDCEADFLLFDTASTQGGGSGAVFDWSVLESYKGEAPFLVAGGVGPENVEGLLRQCCHFEKFRGVDINSAVEVRPGIKDVSKVAEVIRKMRHV